MTKNQAMTKEQARNLIRLQKSKLTNEYITWKSEQITDIVLTLPEFKNAQELFCYVSFNQEVITTKIITTALEQGKRVYVPKVTDGEANLMEFYRILSLKEVSEGYQNIPEPIIGEKYVMINKNKDSSDCSDQKMVSPKERLMILPGLAFDRRGNRVGYGKGFFDYYLEKMNPDSFNRIAMAFDFQIVNGLECMEWDIKVQKLITPDEVIVCMQE